MDVQMKKITDLEGNTRLVPEYESCKKIALAHKIPIKKVYERIDRETSPPKSFTHPLDKNRSRL